MSIGNVLAQGDIKIPKLNIAKNSYPVRGSKQLLWKAEGIKVEAVVPSRDCVAFCDYDFGQLQQLLVDCTGRPGFQSAVDTIRLEGAFLLGEDGLVRDGKVYTDKGTWGFKEFYDAYAQTFERATRTYIFARPATIVLASWQLMPLLKHGCCYTAADSVVHPCPILVSTTVCFERAASGSCFVSIGDCRKEITLSPNRLEDGVWHRDYAVARSNEQEKTVKDVVQGAYSKVYREGIAHVRMNYESSKDISYFLLDDHHTCDGYKTFSMTVTGDTMTLAWPNSTGYEICETWHRVRVKQDKKAPVLDCKDDVEYQLRPSGLPTVEYGDTDEKSSACYTCIVEADGSLSDIKILRATNKLQGKLLAKRLKTLHCQPAVKNGWPVRYFLSKEVVFFPRKEVE